MTKEQFLIWLDRLLMANLFLVLLSFGWLAIALAGRAAHVPLGLDLWYRLWDPLFTPAIGLLMAGALANGIGRWMMRRWQALKGDRPSTFQPLVLKEDRPASSDPES